MNNRRVGVYGGSFDPPHIGHELLARLAVEQFSLDQLLVIPAMVPVHRALSGCVDAATKLGWLQAIWHNDPRIIVLDWECTAAPTPTIDTLHRFGVEYNNVVPLLLMGSDAAAGIDNWIDYPKHRRLCNLAVFRRAGVPPLLSDDGLLSDGWQPVSVAQWAGSSNVRCGRVVPVDCPLPDISASRVRQALKEGSHIRGLVPEVIRDDVCRRYNK